MGFSIRILVPAGQNHEKLSSKETANRLKDISAFAL